MILSLDKKKKCNNRKGGGREGKKERVQGRRGRKGERGRRRERRGGKSPSIEYSHGLK